MTQYHPVDIFVGKRLRHFREQAGLSQKELAAAVDVSFQQLQKYESAANRLSMSKMWALCLRLNVRPNDFFDGIDDIKKGKVPAKSDGRTDRMKLDLFRAWDAIGEIDAKRKLVGIAKVLARLAPAKPARK